MKVWLTIPTGIGRIDNYRRHPLEALGWDTFLTRVMVGQGRGVKQISESQEKAILNTWKNHPGFGPGQVRNQVPARG